MEQLKVKQFTPQTQPSFPSVPEAPNTMTHNTPEP